MLVARAHARVADARRDWQHKLSTAIIRDNQAVYVEDLCVTGLGRTRLAKSVHDAGWASFTAMLEYKAARYGRAFTRVDRFFPSTRMCSDCARINDKMTLDIRTWDCPCGSHHDRDVNAAINIKAAGRADFNDRGAQIRPAAMLAPRGEAVIHPHAARSTRSVEGISVLLGRRERQYCDRGLRILPSVYQTFKQEFVAGWTDTFVVTRRGIVGWLADRFPDDDWPDIA